MWVIQTDQLVHRKWCNQQRQPEFTPCAPELQCWTAGEDVGFGFWFLCLFFFNKKATFFFFSCVAIEKAMQTICWDWGRDKAGRHVCTASGFGKPGFHLLCVPSPFYLLILRCFPAASTCPGSAAPQIQGCTCGSDQSFRGKKHRRRKKYFLIFLAPNQTTLILHSLVKTSGSCIFIS